LLHARVSLLLDRLRLAALAGRLGEEHLQSVNASLQPGCKSKPVASCAQ